MKYIYFCFVLLFVQNLLAQKVVSRNDIISHSEKINDLEIINNQIFIATKSNGVLVLNNNLIDTLIKNIDLYSLNNYENKILINNKNSIIFENNIYNFQDIKKILVSGKNIWILSNDTIFKTNLDLTSKKITKIDSYNIKDITINNFLIKDDSVWIASNKGVYILDKSKKLTNITIDKNNNILGFIYKADTIIAFSKTNIYIYKNQKFENLEFTSLPLKTTDYITDIKFDYYSNLWVVGNKIFKILRTLDSSIYFTTSPEHYDNIAFDSENRTWVSSAGSGAYIIDEGAKVREEQACLSKLKDICNALSGTKDDLINKYNLDSINLGKLDNLIKSLNNESYYNSLYPTEDIDFISIKNCLNSKYITYNNDLKNYNYIVNDFEKQNSLIQLKYSDFYNKKRIDSICFYSDNAKKDWDDMLKNIGVLNVYDHNFITYLMDTSNCILINKKTKVIIPPLPTENPEIEIKLGAPFDSKIEFTENTVYFKDSLKSDNNLKKIDTFWNENDKPYIFLEGYSEYNSKFISELKILSQDRNKKISDYLVSLGVDENYIKVNWHGGIPQKTSDVNKRVDVFISKLLTKEEIISYINYFKEIDDGTITKTIDIKKEEIYYINQQNIEKKVKITNTNETNCLATLIAETNKYNIIKVPVWVASNLDTIIFVNEKNSKIEIINKEINMRYTPDDNNKIGDLAIKRGEIFAYINKKQINGNIDCWYQVYIYGYIKKIK